MQPSDNSSFRFGQSNQLDAALAVAELHAAIMQDEPELVMFFCSSAYDLDALASEINQRFPGIPVLGSTSAGGFGPAFYGQPVLSGLSISKNACSIITGAITGLQSFQPAWAHEMVTRLYRDMETLCPAFVPSNCFAFQMIDGMSFREESVSHAVQSALGIIPLVGGSAGDDMHFKRTWIFFDGAFHQDAVALVLVHTDLPFVSFMTQHFEPVGEPLVVTEADSARRTVLEFNGLPATQEYARCTGVAEDQLDSTLFSNHPMVVCIGDAYYVRGIQRVQPGGRLSFYGAIEEGVVLRVARAVDFLGNLNSQFESIHEKIGEPALVIGCECVMRRLEVERSGLIEPVQQLLAANRTIGFCTYGEQYRGLHLNQTLTGIAIGNRHG